MKCYWVYMTVCYISICHKGNNLLCCRMLSLEVLITYLQALVGVAQAQLPAGHHGLLGGPVLTTDQTPALCPVRVWAQHLDTALIASSSSCDSDLCGTKGLGTTKQSVDTQGSGFYKNSRVELLLVLKTLKAKVWRFDLIIVYGTSQKLWVCPSFWPVLYIFWSFYPAVCVYVQEIRGSIIW